MAMVLFMSAAVFTSQATDHLLIFISPPSVAQAIDVCTRSTTILAAKPISLWRLFEVNTIQMKPGPLTQVAATLDHLSIFLW